MLQRERALFAAFIYDCIIVVPCFIVAVQSGSLTILREVLRGVFLISVAIASWLTLRRIHRGQTGAYDFGMGRIEQILPGDRQIRIKQVLARHYESFDALNGARAVSQAPTSRCMWDWALPRKSPSARWRGFPRLWSMISRQRCRKAASRSRQSCRTSCFHLPSGCYSPFPQEETEHALVQHGRP